MFNRTFGVEIECFGNTNTRAAVVAALRARNIDAVDESYNHTTRAHWKLVGDASVAGCANAFEIVSPVLSGDAGIAQLVTVCEVLHAIGCKVNKTCGVHVHVNGADLTREQLRALVCFYMMFEGAIDGMMAPSRRGNGNRYLRSVRARVNKLFGFTSRTQLKVVAQHLRAADADTVVSRYAQDRYVKLNLASIYRHGTVEFRQHGGTVEAWKIRAWVNMAVMIVERAQRGTLPTQRGTRKTFVRMAPDATTRAAIAKRMNKFAGSEVVA